MEIRDILAVPMSAEEYLAAKRERMRERYTACMEAVRARAGDESYVQRTVRDAEYALQHKFCLPGCGTERWHVGTPPAWFECRTGDHEYTWVLNRHYYFKQLTEAYLLTGDDRYARGAVSDLTNWLDLCPCFPLEGATEEQLRREFAYGVNPWRSFEAGVRMSESWRTLYENLLLTEHMTPELHARISLSAYEHAQMLLVVAPMLHPKADHNHYLVQMQGVLDAVCLFPEWREAAEWQAISVREVVRCALYQFTSEGGQIEASTGYHSMCLLRLYSIQKLAREYGFELPPRFYEVSEQAADYLCHATMPSGFTAAIGDTGFGHHAEGAALEHLKSFGELGVFRKLYPLLSEVGKRRVPAAMAEEAEAFALSRGPEVHFQHELGHYLARTGWRPTDSAFMFTCRTPVNNGHSHQDPLSFVLNLGGTDVVVDPSCYTYVGNVSRYVYKSPAYHACLTFGHRPPFYCTSSWGFTPQKRGTLCRDYRAEGILAADGSHDNYLPNRHQRLCALLGGDVFAVVDCVHNETGEDVTLTFHLADPTLTVTASGARAGDVRMLWAGELQAQAVDAGTAPGFNQHVPSRRLVLDDVSHATDSVYLTLFTKRTDIALPRARMTSDGLRFSFLKGRERISYVWRFGESLKPIG